jgi:hypothetical protein
MRTQPMLAAAAEAAAGGDATAAGRADAIHAHDASQQASTRRTPVRLDAGVRE